MRKIEFTKTEQAILLHRATLHDCLGEVYAHSEYGKYDEATFESVSEERFDKWFKEGEKAAAQIERCIKVGSVNLDALTPVELFMLEDCLNGSTYFADADSEGGWGTVASHRQAARRLVEKFAAHGVKVTVPQA